MAFREVMCEKKHRISPGRAPVDERLDPDEGPGLPLRRKVEVLRSGSPLAPEIYPAKLPRAES